MLQKELDASSTIPEKQEVVKCVSEHLLQADRRSVGYKKNCSFMTFPVTGKSHRDCATGTVSRVVAKAGYNNQVWGINGGLQGGS
jgi:hypothetical protein